MAIKVISICDECGNKHEQIVAPNTETFECPVAFKCSDCILKETKAQPEKDEKEVKV